MSRSKRAKLTFLEKSIIQAWQRQSLWLYALLPLSWLYGLVIYIRKQCYDSGVLSSYRAPVPVLVVGNITVGGAGKTPLVIALVSYLQKHDVAVAVISRGYGAQVADASQPRLVQKDSTPQEVGDEPCEIVTATGVPMCVASDRKAAICLLLAQHPSTELIISDDGLQHYAMQRDIEWVVVDAERGFGSAQLLPVGFLREPLSRLRFVSTIYHQRFGTHMADADRSKNQDSALTMHLQPDDLQHLFNTEKTAHVNTLGREVHAVAGIAHPERFFMTLRTLGFKPREHAFTDHAHYAIEDLNFGDDLPIITTVKDAVKLRHTAVDAQALAQRIWVLPVTAQLSKACYTLLERQLSEACDITIT